MTSTQKKEHQNQKCTQLFLHRESESTSHSVLLDCLRPQGPQPARLLCPWDSPGKNTGVGCHAVLQEIKIQELYSHYVFWIGRQVLYHSSTWEVYCMHAGWVTSVMSDSAAPWTVALQAPRSVGFSRQEYWSGLPCPDYQQGSTVQHRELYVIVCSNLYGTRIWKRMHVHNWITLLYNWN